jgi:hypothetical protein
VGGAPPPPHDFAPQGPKNRRNSAPKGRISGGLAGPRINVVTGGVGGRQPTTRRLVMAGPRPQGGDTPITCRLSRGTGSGNQVWRRFEPTGLISPGSDGSLRRWYAWVSCRGEANGPSETGPDCRPWARAPMVEEEGRAARRWDSTATGRAHRARHLLGAGNSPQTNADMDRGPSRPCPLCLGGSTDALRGACVAHRRLGQ